MTNADAIIDVQNLHKSFGSFEAVRGITFQVKRGEIFAFLGPNGAGKTTTIKILTTLLLPTSGSLRLDGHDPVSHRAAARRSFGIVFQDPSLDDELTAWENLELHGVLYGVGRSVRHTRMDELLHTVDLHERRYELVKNFSGGMKRRLEIARALVHHPSVLFLDEPTVGLDPQARNHLWEYIRRLSANEGMTVFFTTHYMEEASRSAHRVAIVDNGKIVATGTPTELMTRTSSNSLEEAFLTLTGHTIRDEDASATEQLRLARRMWKR